MCGIVGIAGKSPVNQELYDALTMLQHRGQDAAGIVTVQDGRLFLRKDNGMVRDVFHTRHMLRLWVILVLAMCVILPQARLARPKHNLFMLIHLMA
jgi:glutamine phosphoribosylpyrophosphate amidotransferase